MLEFLGLFVNTVQNLVKKQFRIRIDTIIMMFLFLPFLCSSLIVQINNKSPIDSKNLEEAISLSHLPTEDIQSIHLIEGEISIHGIISKYPSLTKFSMERTAYITGNTIPAKCFYKSSIQEVILQNVETIEHDAFALCSKLTTFSAPSLKTVGIRAFQDCVSLTSLAFPNTLTSLPKTVLHGCNSLKTLSIEGMISDIPEFFFSGLPSLKEVFIPSSANNFESPFSDMVNVTLFRPGNYCPSTKIFEFPRFANRLGPNLFDGCPILETVYLHEKVQEIGKFAFANTPHLKNVTFSEPSSLTIIHDYAFTNCSLEYITFPRSLRHNGKNIFANSKNLKYVYVHSTYDFEWLSEGMISNTHGFIEELPEPPRKAEKPLRGFPKYTPVPLRPKQEPVKEQPKPKRNNAKKQNIIFFFSDQQRWDTIGPNGQKLDITPNLDQLARDGVNFKNCFTNQPVCGPVRAVIQSGVYATATKCFKNAVPLPENQPNRLADELKKAGYSLAYIGKWHLASDEKDQRYETKPVPLKYRGGWDEYWVAADVIEFTSHGYGGYLYDQDMNKREFTGYRVDCVTDFALEYIRNYDNEDKPFVMFLSHLEPHHQNDHFAFEGPTGSKEKFKDFEQPADLTKGRGDWEKWMPDYLGCCNALDKNLGRVMDALKEKGIYDDTMIIYTSDHGCHFKSHTEDIEPGGSDDYKRSSYESAIHIPFVIKGEGFGVNEESDRIISSIDFPSTLVRAAGGEIPSSWKGRCIQDYKNENWQDIMYSQVSESYVGRFIRTLEWKYVIHATGLKPFNDMGTDQDKWTDKHLFNIKNDPAEKKDLKDDPNYNDIKQELRKLIIEQAYLAGEGNFTIYDDQTVTNEL